MGNYFVLTKSLKTTSGLWHLNLNAFTAKGEHIGKLTVRSGLAHAQNFRTKEKEVKGRGEPVPEHVYTLGSLDWHGGYGNYNSLWPNILSPIWVTIDPLRAIGFHLDHPSGQPGTLGCVGFLNMADLKTFVKWYKDHGRFSKMYVDWGLGTVQPPEQHEEQKQHCNHPTGEALVFGKVVRYVNFDGETWVRSTEIGKATWNNDRQYKLTIE